MANLPEKKNIPFNHILAALLNSQNIFPPTYLHHFSDLEGKDLESLRQAWPEISPQRRFTLLEDLEELAELDMLVSYGQMARLALNDTDPRVRTVAVRMLWEDDDPLLAPIFMKMMAADANTDVRAAAATALGVFIYQGEIEEFPEEMLRRVEDALLGVITSQEDKLIRRRALESMGFSSRKEVPGLIREAYITSDTDWLTSALFAMGRSADNVWAPDVMRMLHHPKGSVQLEAVRASGSLEMEGSRRVLLDLLEEEAQDPDMRLAVFWSLSQIGGEEVRETLEKIAEETEDEDELEYVEKALDNLSFTEDADIVGMFDLENMSQEMNDEGTGEYIPLDQLDISEDEDKPSNPPGDENDPD